MITAQLLQIITHAFKKHRTLWSFLFRWIIEEKTIEISVNLSLLTKENLILVIKICRTSLANVYMNHIWTHQCPYGRYC